MQHHTDLINYIIKEKGFKKYLELGTQFGKNFNAIDCMFKHSVDPDPQAAALYKMTSDEFFEQNKNTYQIIFIDALHTAEQVEKDFINSMAVLEDGGFIIIHDTNPEKEEWTIVPRETKQWTGSVYKFICNLEADFKTLPFDYGMTIVKKSEYKISDNEITWEGFCNDRNRYLRIANVEQIKAWIAAVDVNRLILLHLTEGLTLKEVAAKVSLSYKAVQKRIWNMKKCSGVKNITELVASNLRKEVVN